VVAHLAGDVLKARRADDAEADEEDVGLGIRERPQSVVVLLTGSIPEPEVDGLAVDHDVGRVVLLGSELSQQYAHRRAGARQTRSGCIRPASGDQLELDEADSIHTGKAFCTTAGQTLSTDSEERPLTVV
jgi:hypothetical protein